MSQQSKILILGTGGQVGTELQRSFADAGEVIACDRKAADLSRPEELRGLIQRLHPDVILNAAAYTAVDRAESEPELAMTINCEAPRVVAEEAARLNALLVHYSTDYVFDGTKQTPWVETDEPNPLSVYGRTKLAGERAIQEVDGRYLIFRTSWVYGPHGHNFLLTMLRLGRERDQLRIVNDQFGAPTTSLVLGDFTRSAVDRALAQTSQTEWVGIYHLTCAGQTTWHGFASDIFRTADAPSGRRWPSLQAITSDEYPTPAKRPANSLLSNDKAVAAFGIALPTWQSALDEILGALGIRCAIQVTTYPAHQD